VKKEYLMAPGPTPVPPEVLLEMSKPIFHHRTPRFRQVFGEFNEFLKIIFKTQNPVLTFASSGSGAMEASIINTLSPGDKAIVIIGGKFGERFSLICKAYGISTIDVELEWGTPVDPQHIAGLLKDNPDVKAVFSTLCETSSGIVTDIKALGEVVGRTDAILVTDAISGLGADDIRTDEWAVDITVGGSQKGLMLPPGLAFMTVSEKAKKMMRNSKCPKFYFNALKALKSVEGSDTPWTPAITLITGGKKALDIIVSEGIDNVIARHARLANATRVGVQALGLELFALAAPSNALTAVKVPENIDGLQFVKKIRDEIGITIAGGQAQVKGKIFRVAHLGYSVTYDVLIALSGIETVLKELGYDFKAGSSLQAAQQAFLQ